MGVLEPECSAAMVWNLHRTRGYFANNYVISRNYILLFHNILSIITRPYLIWRKGLGEETRSILQFYCYIENVLSMHTMFCHKLVFYYGLFSCIRNSSIKDSPNLHPHLPTEEHCASGPGGITAAKAKEMLSSYLVKGYVCTSV